MVQLDVNKFKTLGDKYDEFKASYCRKYSNLKAWGRNNPWILGKCITAVEELLDFLKETEELVYDNSPSSHALTMYLFLFSLVEQHRAPLS